MNATSGPRDEFFQTIPPAAISTLALPFSSPFPPPFFHLSSLLNRGGRAWGAGERCDGAGVEERERRFELWVAVGIVILFN